MDTTATGDRMTVSLRELRVELPIGVAEWERAPGKAQLVLINIDLYAVCPPEPPRNLDDCLDYDALYRYVQDDVAGRGHTELLETLAHDISEFCLKSFPIDSCRVSLSKPHVYNGAATPSVEIIRHRRAEPTGGSG